MANKRGKAAAQPVEAPQEARLRTEEEEVQDLLNEFRARTEESLVILFYKEQGYDAARETLLTITANYQLEENSGFDPSGLQSAANDSYFDALGSSDADLSSRGNKDGRPSSGRLTTATSEDDSGPFSPAMSTFGGSLDDWRSLAYELPTDDAQDTLSILRAAFPGLKENDIKHALKQADDDVSRASDILLNIHHLEETSQRPKGIEGFFADGGGFVPSAKKRKRNSKQKQPKVDQVPVAYKLKPVELENEEDSSAAAGRKQASRSALPVLPASPEELHYAQEAARVSRERSSQAYQSASDAIRRGKSDPLYRQAAVVYAERGKENARVARLYESMQSDSIVDKQSSGNTVDVHYVPVHDGVRIALERTQRWWSNLGEDRARKAREYPLRVVTGIGRHSSGGHSPMYGQVGRALEADGWKVQVGIGHYGVTGRKI